MNSTMTIFTEEQAPERTSTNTSNLSNYLKAEGKSSPKLAMISYRTYEFVLISLCFALLIMSLVGCISNIFVLLTYRKIGFAESINISYAALAVSDIGAVITRAWGGLCFVFILWNVDLPFDAIDVTRVTAFWYGNGFEKTTACITAYVALERCLCVLFPLHVKSMVTQKKTVTVLIAFFILVFGVATLSHVVNPLEWSFNPARNRSILRSITLTNAPYPSIRQFLFAYFGSFLYFSTVIPVWICTIVLAFHLKKGSKALEGSINQTKRKETHVVRVVFAIAAAFLLFSTPTAVVLLVPIFVPGFNTRGPYQRTSLILYHGTGLLGSFNSSTNLFIYLYTGAKFRETFLKLVRFKKE